MPAGLITESCDTVRKPCVGHGINVNGMTVRRETVGLGDTSEISTDDFAK